MPNCVINVFKDNTKYNNSQFFIELAERDITVSTRTISTNKELSSFLNTRYPLSQRVIMVCMDDRLNEQITNILCHPGDLHIVTTVLSQCKAQPEYMLHAPNIQNPIVFNRVGF